ncbi:MAG: GNAT family N-acetyltransferase [Candidatus Binataceae bacterium]
MAIRIENPEGRDDLIEFVLFHDKVYEYRSARWPANLVVQLPFLLGEGPASQGRKLRPFIARDGDRILARALAVWDERYNRYWKERLGHLTMFEAMPGTREAVKQMIDAACEWLRQQGAEAARSSNYFPTLDLCYVIDEYEMLPPMTLRQNPSYYHSLLKDAGFETEKGMVDYKIEVKPELVARYESALESARRAEFAIVPLKDVAPARRIREYTATYNEAFKRHWGYIPATEEENAELFEILAPGGALDTSVLAYRGQEPVGALLVVPDMSSGATLSGGRALEDSEKLNMLGIGVLEPARGRGVNLAMASYAYLELIRRGAKYLSYTLVLDDNWPSRRTAEKLGATVCASYLVYRRNFRN